VPVFVCIHLGLLLAMTKKSQKSSSPREAFQRKKAKKGHRSSRGVPEKEADALTTAATYSITLPAREAIKAKAKKIGISASALLEDIARDRYLLIPTDAWLNLQKEIPSEAVKIIETIIIPQAHSSGGD
jgi:hypothetical protein